jgi:hypothetical protein
MLSSKRASGSLAAIAGALAVMLAAATGEAAVLPAPVAGYSISGVQLAGDVCGPGRQMGPGGRRCWPN